MASVVTWWSSYGRETWCQRSSWRSTRGCAVWINVVTVRAWRWMQRLVCVRFTSNVHRLAATLIAVRRCAGAHLVVNALRERTTQRRAGRRARRSSPVRIICWRQAVSKASRESSATGSILNAIVSSATGGSVAVWRRFWQSWRRGVARDSRTRKIFSPAEPVWKITATPKTWAGIAASRAVAEQSVRPNCCAQVADLDSILQRRVNLVRRQGSFSSRPVSSRPMVPAKLAIRL